jgi:hypothetical protein
MQFYMNRQRPNNGSTIISTDSFFKYYNTCKRYNIISECMEEEPESAQLSWNEKKGCIIVMFPADGLVAERLSILEDRGNPSNFGGGLFGESE